MLLGLLINEVAALADYIFTPKVVSPAGKDPAAGVRSECPLSRNIYWCDENEVSDCGKDTVLETSLCL